MSAGSETESESGRSLLVRGLLLGERLDIRGLEQKKPLATTPLTIRAGRKGFAVLFRYGAVVLFDLSAEEEAYFLSDIDRLILDPLPTPVREEAHIDLDPDAAEQVAGDGVILLHEITPERLQVVADAIGKNLLLEHYELRLNAVFDRVEPLAASLKQHGRRNFRVRDLLALIGDVLLTEHRMVGRAEMLEKPEALWDQPELEKLFGRLEREYEIRERSRALERKLEVVGDTAETLLDLVQTQRSMRAEWYIIALILLELMLSLYQMFGAGLLHH